MTLILITVCPSNPANSHSLNFLAFTDVEQWHHSLKKQRKTPRRRSQRARYIQHLLSLDSSRKESTYEGSFPSRTAMTKIITELRLIIISQFVSAVCSQLSERN